MGPGVGTVAVEEDLPAPRSSDGSAQVWRELGVRV